MTLTGKVSNYPDLKATFDEYNRVNPFESYFFAVSDADKSFSTPYDGYFGIKPHSPLAQADKKMNAMYNLVENAEITYNMISIWASMDSKHNSNVKFGGWDIIGMAQGQQMKFYQTITNDAWRLTAPEVKFTGLVNTTGLI